MLDQVVDFQQDLVVVVRIRHRALSRLNIPPAGDAVVDADLHQRRIFLALLKYIRAARAERAGHRLFEQQGRQPGNGMSGGGARRLSRRGRLFSRPRV